MKAKLVCGTQRFWRWVLRKNEAEGFIYFTVNGTRYRMKVQP